MGRKLQGDPAGIANSFAHPLGELDVMTIAGGKVRPALRNADDRLAAGQLLTGEPEIEIAFEIERRHPGIVGIVEP